MATALSGPLVEISALHQAPTGPQGATPPPQQQNPPPPTAPTTAQPPPQAGVTIAVDVPIVTLDVVATTQRGDIIPGLKKENFRIHGDGSFGGGEVGDGLRHAIVKDAKVFLFQARNDVAALRGGDYVEGHDGNIDRNGDPCLRRLLRRSG